MNSTSMAFIVAKGVNFSSAATSAALLLASMRWRRRVYRSAMCDPSVNNVEMMSWSIMCRAAMSPSTTSPPVLGKAGNFAAKGCT